MMVEDDTPTKWLLRQIGYASVYAATYGDVTRLRHFAEQMARYLGDEQIVNLFADEMEIDGFDIWQEYEIP